MKSEEPKPTGLSAIVQDAGNELAGALLASKRPALMLVLEPDDTVSGIATESLGDLTPDKRLSFLFAASDMLRDCVEGIPRQPDRLS
ncbi:hypothetical protein [Pukyongiella litopenaei]|uniref:Uncharacterized protein n=1 Tax=Pukyongiella litopenaei TaxID=2605946 RepID=A0A2S0MPY3_9RHOB|nr:hypothetical protein [Pukyongiella litopenaei]AVO37924.1 hypothetical protein C6Y53_09555 [Pukyongiella litopenaei]